LPAELLLLGGPVAHVAAGTTTGRWKVCLSRFHTPVPMAANPSAEQRSDNTRHRFRSWRRESVFYQGDETPFLEQGIVLKTLRASAQTLRVDGFHCSLLSKRPCIEHWSRPGYWFPEPQKITHILSEASAEGSTSRARARASSVVALNDSFPVSMRWIVRAERPDLDASPDRLKWECSRHRHVRSLPQCYSEYRKRTKPSAILRPVYGPWIRTLLPPGKMLCA
jgi:hypothetical protein